MAQEIAARLLVLNVVDVINLTVSLQVQPRGPKCDFFLVVGDMSFSRRPFAFGLRGMCCCSVSVQCFEHPRAPKSLARQKNRTAGAPELPLAEEWTTRLMDNLWMELCVDPCHVANLP